MGRALGIKTLNTKGGARTDEALADLIEGVNTLLDNIPDIALNLGNHKGNRLQGLADYQAVMPELPERARVLLDTGHLLSVGEPIMPFAEALAGRIGLVHLRDQQGEKPVPFGEGELPFAELFKLLLDNGYDGPLRPSSLRRSIGTSHSQRPLPRANTSRPFSPEFGHGAP